MNGISLLVAITKREFEEDYISLLKRNPISAIFSTPCRGTAGETLLRMLGLDKAEKTLLFAMAESRRVSVLLQKMISALGINLAGNGIAVSIPVGSIGGASCMKYLMEGQDIIIGEVTEVEQKVFPYELIVAVVENGTADMVMTAARKANAGGGTVIHAKGTGTDFTSKFFGVSIATEKEIVLIVTSREDKPNIMRAIMAEAGIRSEAHTALFSLPVEDVVGLTSVMKLTPEDM